MGTLYASGIILGFVGDPDDLTGSGWSLYTDADGRYIRVRPAGVAQATGGGPHSHAEQSHVHDADHPHYMGLLNNTNAPDQAAGMGTYTGDTQHGHTTTVATNATTPSETASENAGGESATMEPDTISIGLIVSDGTSDEAPMSALAWASANLFGAGNWTYGGDYGGCAFKATATAAEYGEYSGTPHIHHITDHSHVDLDHYHNWPSGESDISDAGNTPAAYSGATVSEHGAGNHTHTFSGGETDSEYAVFGLSDSDCSPVSGTDMDLIELFGVYTHAAIAAGTLDPVAGSLLALWDSDNGAVPAGWQVVTVAPASQVPFLYDFIEDYPRPGVSLGYNAKGAAHEHLAPHTHSIGLHAHTTGDASDASYDYADLGSDLGRTSTHDMTVVAASGATGTGDLVLTDLGVGETDDAPPWASFLLIKYVGATTIHQAIRSAQRSAA